MSVVKSVVPNALIVENRVDVYPVKVTITVDVKGQKALQVYTCKQQDLFRKYASRRTKAMQEIEQALEDLKEDFDLE